MNTIELKLNELLALTEMGMTNIGRTHPMGVSMGDTAKVELVPSDFNGVAYEVMPFSARVEYVHWRSRDKAPSGEDVYTLRAVRSEAVA